MGEVVFSQLTTPPGMGRKRKKLSCMGTFKTGTKLVVGTGTVPLYLFRSILSILLVVSSHSSISLYVTYKVALEACVTDAIIGVCNISLKFKVLRLTLLVSSKDQYGVHSLTNSPGILALCMH